MNENDFPPSEPHKIISCAKCGEAKHLEFRLTGDDELYYRCPCGFESQPLGPSSQNVIDRMNRQ